MQKVLAEIVNPKEGFVKAFLVSNTTVLILNDHLQRQ